MSSSNILNEVTMKQIEQQPVERVRENRSPEVDAETTVSVGELHESLRSMADSFDVSDFKCAKCGLVHTHDTTKHKLSETFDISESDAATLFEYNSVCHCGVQEAARRGSDFGIDEAEASSIARDAPIPPESSRKMDEELGAL